MLNGEAVVAIWNDITDAGREDFYAWHLHEHIPERVGIPGFRRGRRYRAHTPATQPEFFTLYEAETLAVLTGREYLARLNAPTPWTRRATGGFRNTSRAVARVLRSVGPGAGGVALTLRFDAPHDRVAALAALLDGAVAAPRVTGAHLCAAELDASGQATAESAGRTDLQSPPAWFAIVEATDAAALDHVLVDEVLRDAGAVGSVVRGVYCLEYAASAV